jgi:mitogen-activated protein kinase 1/3
MMTSYPSYPQTRQDVENSRDTMNTERTAKPFKSRKAAGSGNGNPGYADTAAVKLKQSTVMMCDEGTEVIIPPHLAYNVHSFKAGSHTFTVDKKYSFIRVIGSGAYGVVVSALDVTTNKKVAIKMVPRAFNDEIDAKRILREIKLLKHLRHENIISIVDMMPPAVRFPEDYHNVYIVADLMETDLHRIIYSKQSLSMEHVQYFVYQILRALKYIHSANVLHRDLKPSNLLVNSNCDLKICDFGLARGVVADDDPENSANVGGTMLLTEYVVTRWYRAPEIMLACHQYTKPIDVWSVGCIFAELIARKPYFPGEDYIDQLTIISDKLGKLSEEDMDFVTSEKAKRFMRKLPNKPVIPMRKQFPTATPEAVDLLGKMLQIHPKKRITVDDALRHPFLAQLHSPDDEPTAKSAFDFGFEDEKLHRVRLQELIWQEVGDFRPEVLPVPPRKDGTREPLRRRQIS